MTSPTLASLAAAAVLALTAAPAGAFSQIGTQTGAAPQRDGIVSVPLPPLAGTTEPEKPGTGTMGPEAAPAPAPAPAATTPPTDGGTAPAVPGAANPAPAEASPVPDDQTDQGETEDPAIDLGPTGDGETDPGEPANGAEVRSDAAPAEDAAPPPIFYGDEGLPKPVKDIRDRLIAIAKAGNIEALRPYIQPGEDGTVLSFGETEGDPIAFLKAASGDGEGVEILAIMLEILQAGHVRNEPDTDDEIFVWPYFTSVAIDKLTKPQKVELFELVTAGDYQEMVGFGAYNFYRIGISPDGKLQFFVAGD